MPYVNKQANANPTVTPTVSTGVLAPATTPGKIGDIFVDTNLGKVYIAAGTSASSDWKILN